MSFATAEIGIRFFPILFYAVSKGKSSVHVITTLSPSDINILAISQLLCHMASACDLLHQPQINRMCLPRRVQSRICNFDLFCSTGTRENQTFNDDNSLFDEMTENVSYCQEVP